jgi:PhnB protein
MASRIMAPNVKPVPEGYHTVTPYLTVKGADKLVEFLKKAFGAQERFQMPGPDGKLAHAEIQIGDSVVMMGEGGGQAPIMPAQLYLYVDDCDRYYKQALAAGATSVREPATQFYGDRNATVKDMCGNVWSVATHVEDVSGEEVERRMKAMKK